MSLEVCRSEASRLLEGSRLLGGKKLVCWRGVFERIQMMAEVVGLCGGDLVCWRGVFEWIQVMAEVVGLRGGDLVAVGVLGSRRVCYDFQF